MQQTLATGGTNNTEPTGELFDLMTQVGAIEETAKNEGIYINLLTVPLNNCSRISEISNELLNLLEGIEKVAADNSNTQVHEVNITSEEVLDSGIKESETAKKEGIKIIVTFSPKLNFRPLQQIELRTIQPLHSFTFSFSPLSWQ